MKPTLLQLGLFVFLTSTQQASAQRFPISFQHLSVEQGLSYNTAYAITQDRHGLIWIATNDGLNRFDGYRMETFRNKLSDKNSLPSNGVISLFTDSRGIVWIGTGNGFAYYNERTNSFRSFVRNPDDKNSIPGFAAGVIAEDKRGIMWIGTGKGLCSYEIRNDRFQVFRHDKHSNSISSNAINDIKFAPDGTMWISTGDGLNRLDLSTMKFTSFYNDPNDTSTLSGNALGKMQIDKLGNLWIINGPYLDCFNTKTNRCKHFTNFFEKQSTVADNFPYSILIDSKERFWIGTSQSGLCLFSPDKNSFFAYKLDPLNSSSLQSNKIASIYQDQSGMIWLGTMTAGVERFNPDESKFVLYRSQSAEPLNLYNRSVQAIAEDSSFRLWVGTSDGISILDRNTGILTDYKRRENDPHSLSSNSILSICRDKQGNMWIGTLNGLNLYDPVQKNFHSFYADSSDHSLAGNAITSIICDKNGDLLITSRPGGLTIYNSKTKRFSNFKNDAQHALLNDNIQLIVVFEDNRGILWIGVRSQGLLKYDRSTGKLEHFTFKLGDSTSLPAAYVGSITQDHKGTIWIGTAGGLCRFDEATRKFITLNEKNGLANVRIKQLLVDDKDRIWMGTNKGISMLNESRTTFTNYDPSDGLQGLEFSDGAACKTHDGFFCYGGSNGFNMFHPDSIKRNLSSPSVILNGITIFDHPLKVDSPYSILKSLRLSHKQNFFSFEFAALNYDHPEKNQYACQLVPFDKQMRRLGTNHSISYTNVPPGHYTLKVKASNNDGIWNEQGYELPLTIVPPFWATTWFKVIVIGLFIGAVFLFLRLRDKRIRKEQAHQIAINKQLAETRMTALQAQMNPHFIFNSLNSIQHLISIREKEEAISYLSKFSKLIRKTLESSRENAVPISNELESLVLYIELEQLRFNHKFDYHISVDKRIDKENMEIPPLLIQPYVENAILHGLVNKDDKGHLWLSLDRNNGSLVCKIEDNGVGRDKAGEIERKKVEKHKSLGIIVTNERISTLASLLDYNIKVEIEDLFETQQTDVSPRPTGTRVTILIPLKHAE